ALIGIQVLFCRIPDLFACDGFVNSQFLVQFIGVLVIKSVAVGQIFGDTQLAAVGIYIIIFHLVLQLLVILLADQVSLQFYHFVVNVFQQNFVGTVIGQCANNIHAIIFQRIIKSQHLQGLFFIVHHLFVQP